MEAHLKQSTNPAKKWMVKIYQKDNLLKTVHFGAKGSLDFSSGKRTPQDKENYIKRHSVNENWEDPFTSGFWARWLLWNKNTIPASSKDISKRFNIKVIGL